MKESSDPILLVLEGTYPWYRGGVSEWVHQYLQHTSKRPFHIIQVATGEYRHVSLKEALYDVPNHINEFERVLPPRLSGQSNIALTGWLKSVQKKLKPLVRQSEFVHILNTGFAGWLGKKLASQFQKPLFLTEHALYWKEIAMGAVALECGYKIPEEKEEKKAFARVFRDIAAEIYRNSDAVVSVSECNIPEQQKLGARNVRYIPNGIPAGWLKHSSPEPSSLLTIGWIGRCAEMKNPLKFFEVIEAFKQQSIENIRFLMMSCDAGEPELAHRVKSKVREYEHLELIWNKSTGNFIDRMDALCITSHNESQPLVLLEALSRKVLPIGWRTGDVSSKYGLILEPEATAGDLASAVMNHWHNPEQWRRAVERRFAKVQADHTWEKIFNTYHALFSAIKLN